MAMDSDPYLPVIICQTIVAVALILCFTSALLVQSDETRYNKRLARVESQIRALQQAEKTK